MKNTELDKITRLIVDIFETPEAEVNCDIATNQMIQSLNANLNEEESKKIFTELWHHLRFCEECFNDYQLLLDLNTEIDAYEIKATAFPRKLRKENLNPWWPLGKLDLKLTLGDFKLVQTDLTLRSETPQYKPQTIHIEELNADIRLILEPGELDDTKDLFVTIKMESGNLEGASLWLKPENENSHLIENSMDAVGGTFFSTLGAGTFSLLVQLQDRGIVIQDIKIP